MVALSPSLLNESYIEPSRYDWLRARAPVPTTYAPACEPLAEFAEVSENRTSRARGITTICTGVLLVSYETASSYVVVWLELRWIEHNGEAFDSRVGQMYVRARFYDLHRFTTIDPFFGNRSDPLSFNKFGFVHANPIMGIDPTGLAEFSLGGMLATSAKFGLIGGMTMGTIGAVHGYIKNGVKGAIEGGYNGFLNGLWMGATAGAAMYGLAWYFMSIAAAEGLTLFGAWASASIIVGVPFRVMAFYAYGKALESGDKVDSYFALAGVILSFLPNATPFYTPAVRSQVHTKPNQAFFWTGETNGILASEVAETLARQRGGKTFEMLVKENGIKIPENQPARLQAQTELSVEYAMKASGEVRAVVGANRRPDNVWENSELPMLKENPNVTKIIEIDPVTLNEKIIFTR
jgi:RHS repeat-associated protein